MKSEASLPSNRKLKPATWRLLLVALFFTAGCASQAQEPRTEEISFRSGSFEIVGELHLPVGIGLYPVVVFVHGDGPNDRSGGGTYPPIMARMASAGYATFAWDKPETGESSGEIDRSRLGEQRAKIMLDAIEVLKARADIDPEKIGLWGISQAGYVMPRALSKSEDIAFMIAVSCPGMAGVDQGAYLVAAQAACAGIPEKQVEQIRDLLSAIERVEAYEAYVQYKQKLDVLPGMESAKIFGYTIGILPEERWHAPDPEGEYFWNPIEAIEQTSIPVLAFFGEKDTQVDPFQGALAYREALERAGNPKSRVELIPGADHNIILSESGCLEEREKRWPREWVNYAPEYLDILEEWLKELHQ
jgi:pimeloyl-ACP methyl ester carboxylesterase